MLVLKDDEQLCYLILFVISSKLLSEVTLFILPFLRELQSQPQMLAQGSWSNLLQLYYILVFKSAFSFFTKSAKHFYIRAEKQTHSCWWVSVSIYLPSI